MKIILVTNILYFLFLNFITLNAAIWQINQSEHSLNIVHYQSGLSIDICLNSPPTLSSKTLVYKEQHASFEFDFKHQFTCHFTEFEYHFEHDTLLLIGYSFQRRCGNDSLAIKVFKKSDGLLSIKLSGDKRKYNYSKLTLKVADNLHFYGGGVQFSHFRLNCHRIPIFVEEQGIGRGDMPVSLLTRIAGVSGHAYSTYAPIPWILSSDANGYYLKEDGLSFLDLTNDGYISFENFFHELNLDVYHAEDIPALLKQFTKDNGRMPVLPDWAFGTWLGLQGGKDKVIEIVDTAKSKGNPVTAIWIQDWVGKRQTPIGSRLWWTWKPDTLSYGNIQEFIQKMHQREVRVLGYINPFFTNSGKYFEEGIKNDFFINNQNGSPLKFTNPGIEFYLLNVFDDAAVEWVKEIINTQLLGNGFSGWMADFGEWLPINGVSQPMNKRLTALHNLYADKWMQINREAVEGHSNPEDIVVFNRSGFRNIMQHSIAMWLGDQTTDYGKHDGLPSAITGKLSAGMSGITNIHSDIGGYTNVSIPFLRIIRDRDLMMRWIEMNAFNLIFRTHEGLMPDENLQVYSDEQIIEFFARFGRLHYALKPYLKKLNKESASYGFPLIRPLFFHFTHDNQLFLIEDQYLLGEAILVAPVVQPRQFVRQVYLPSGNWKHAWTGLEFKSEGDFFDIKAPYGQPPVFLFQEAEDYELLKIIFKELM